jgi:hypothetical protein
VVDVKLADEMVRDPGILRIVHVEGEPLVRVVLSRLYAKLGMNTVVIPLIASHHSEEKRIIDAKLDGPCLVCGEAVWLSPTSQSIRSKNVVLLCWLCVVQEARDVLTSLGATSSQLDLLAPLTSTEAQPSK